MKKTSPLLLPAAVLTAGPAHANAYAAAAGDAFVLLYALWVLASFAVVHIVLRCLKKPFAYRQWATAAVAATPLVLVAAWLAFDLHFNNPTTEMRLTQPQVYEGLEFPAGSVVTYTPNPEHKKTQNNRQNPPEFYTISLPEGRTVDIMGLNVQFIQKHHDGIYTVGSNNPSPIEGWPCQFETTLQKSANQAWQFNACAFANTPALGLHWNKARVYRNQAHSWTLAGLVYQQNPTAPRPPEAECTTQDPCDYQCLQVKNAKDQNPAPCE